MRMALAVVFALCLGACGEADGGTGRFAVVRGDLAWTGSEQAGAPLSRTWTKPDLVGSWRPVGGTQVTPGSESLGLRRTRAVILTGPREGELDLSVHHWLRLRFASRGVAHVEIAWGGGESGTPTRRSAEVPVISDGAVHETLVPLRSFQGERVAGGAIPGDGGASGELHVRFQGAEGEPAEVDLQEITLGSSYQDPSGAGFVEARLRAGSVERAGVALRAPGWAAATLPLRAGDRVCFGLAAVGTTDPLAVVARIGAQHLYLTCRPGEGWQDRTVEIARDAGDEGAPVRFDVKGSTGPDAVLLVGGLLHLRRDREARPDVIVYLEDTLRADHLTTYGWRRDTDPALREIARQGAVFERAFSTSNWTRPAVSSLMTSLTPAAHGNDRAARRVPASLPLLAEVLAEHGYVTASFITNPHAGSWSGLEQGFDFHAELGVEGDEVESTLTSELIREPIDATLARFADVRLFVYAHSLDPHRPYLPPSSALDALVDATARAQGVTFAGAPEEIQAAKLALMAETGTGPMPVTSVTYDAEILFNDGRLGVLDDALARAGARADTLLVFTSDHGEGFGEHERWAHHQGLYQEELHVPLVFRWPARIPAGRRVDAPASLIDVAPTILGLIGAPAPEVWEGRDLSASLTGGAPDEHAAPPILVDTVYAPEHERAGRELAVVRWPYKLIVRVAPDGLRPTGLYDLDADPGEVVDLRERADIEPITSALRAVAEQVLERSVLRDEGGTAAPMDARLEEWLRAMGYLR